MPELLGRIAAAPVRCPACGVLLSGPIMTDLVATMRQADSLVLRMRAGAASVTGLLVE